METEKGQKASQDKPSEEHQIWESNAPSECDKDMNFRIVAKKKKGMIK